MLPKFYCIYYLPINFYILLEQLKQEWTTSYYLCCEKKEPHSLYYLVWNDKSHKNYLILLFILFKVPILSMYVCNWIGMLLNTDTAPLSHPNIVNSAGVNKDEIDLWIIKSPGHLLYFPLHCCAIRDTNSPAILIPRGFREWGLHFFIPRGSGKLEPIPRGPRGIFGELDPLKQAILCNKYDT